MTSLVIGRNAAYLNQFIHRSTPRILAGHDREALAARFGLPVRGAQTRPNPTPVLSGNEHSNTLYSLDGRDGAFDLKVRRPSFGRQENIVDGPCDIVLRPFGTP